MTPIRAIATALLLSTAALPAAAQQAVASGSFEGRSDHETSGGVEIVQADGGGYTVVLGDDFAFDGAPDPKFGFGNGGSYDSETTFAALEKNSGKQSYEVPEGVDPAAYDEFYLWCEKFSVPLGVAKLQ